jgi:hypothetical protein
VDKIIIISNIIIIFQFLSNYRFVKIPYISIIIFFDSTLVEYVYNDNNNVINFLIFAFILVLKRILPNFFKFDDNNS